MITHDQMIFAIRAILPQITDNDHGRKYLVGMPVDGDTQTGEAFVAKWELPYPQPSFDQIMAKWETVKDAFEDTQLAHAARFKRDGLLEKSDVMLIRAQEVGADTTALVTYRQALRDIPEQAGFPRTINWPALPA